MKKGKHYYNNGIEEHLYFEGEQPAGYVPGGLSKNKGKIPHNKNKISITNGNTNKYIYENEFSEYEKLGWTKNFIYSELGLIKHRENTKNYRANKSKEKWIEDHLKRSEGAKNMWKKRTPEEILSICKNGLDGMSNCEYHRGPTSKEEKLAFEIFTDVYGPENVLVHYDKDPRYPYHCDFYIKSEDLFIELNIFPTHYREPFDKNNQEHLRILEDCKKVKHPDFITSGLITVWAGSDAKKFSCAKENKLNYKVYYDMEELINEYRIKA